MTGEERQGYLEALLDLVAEGETTAETGCMVAARRGFLIRESDLAGYSDDARDAATLRDDPSTVMDHIQDPVMPDYYKDLAASFAREREEQVAAWVSQVAANLREPSRG